LAEPVFILVALVAAVVIFLWVRALGKKDWLIASALSLILGGTIGIWLIGWSIGMSLTLLMLSYGLGILDLQHRRCRNHCRRYGCWYSTRFAR